jgi:hypothetical protein
MQSLCHSRNIGKFREIISIGTRPPRGWNHGARQGLERITAKTPQQELQIRLNCRAAMMLSVRYKVSLQDVIRVTRIRPFFHQEAIPSIRPIDLEVPARYRLVEPV